MKKLRFLSLAGARIREAQLSDHEPLISQDTISWNIMMPGSFRKNRYNNGFALIEDQAQYHQRLRNIAAVLAEICHQNPQVSVICLQEAPVKFEDIKVFVRACLEYPSLRVFSESLQDTSVYTAWGLVTLVDTTRHDYEVQSVTLAKDNLKDRIQSLHLKGENNRTITNLHLPYECKNEPQRMARFVYKMMYKQMSAFTLAGDFNMSFTQTDVIKIMNQLGRVFAPCNNSTEFDLEHGGSNSLETVDAIICNDTTRESNICNLSQSSLLRFTGGYHGLRFEEEYVDNLTKNLPLLYDPLCF